MTPGLVVPGSGLQSDLNKLGEYSQAEIIKFKLMIFFNLIGCWFDPLVKSIISPWKLISDYKANGYLSLTADSEIMLDYESVTCGEFVNTG